LYSVGPWIAKLTFYFEREEKEKQGSLVANAFLLEETVKAPMLFTDSPHK
jgi:hypothetical protein